MEINSISVKFDIGFCFYMVFMLLCALRSLPGSELSFFDGRGFKNFTAVSQNGVL